MNDLKIRMYSSRYCPFCIQAKSILEQKGLGFDEIIVDQRPELREKMIEESGARTVPQIWIGERHIGGCQELMAIERSGGLDELIKTA